LGHAASQGWVLSAFFYGYVTTGYLGGMLATRYGGFYTLLGAVVGWSLVSAPSCISLRGNPGVRACAASV
jgi:MFS family permease